jgi:hypothetical protein
MAYFDDFIAFPLGLVENAGSARRTRFYMRNHASKPRRGGTGTAKN